MLRQIASRRAKVGVIGLGYVGLPLALTAARAGFPVLGFDIDEASVAAAQPRRELHQAHRRGRHPLGDRGQRFEATADFAGSARPTRS